ncbi:heme utilization protein [Pseudomonas marginalis ICMP 9505]|uniref:Heme utilization protein n=1 Tax=Pseudomonas kitaguniensis TaxID=2607908 RepID=A0A5N7JXU3_9PSED|nr:hypothetical protein [Pseudomonas kitaguniensis]KTC25915.1 heme utilization protein [Pseudomonas marginalis ICMP 9505]MPQ86176.1 heme utilization protein [Pseudomonas kitaguniensis]
MKTTMALKPLAFALAALMAVAAQASGPTTTSNATANDGQNNHGNVVLNDKTENSASVNNSLNNYSGVVGNNTLSGDNNQGKNDVAITSGDADFVFATVNSKQSSGGNLVISSASKNNASVNDSGNNGSGIIQSTVASGTSNQGSNSTVINSGNGKAGSATVNAVQDVSGNLSVNLSSGNAYYGQSKAVANSASVNNSFNHASGVVGTNTLSGGNNQAQNNVAITRF